MKLIKIIVLICLLIIPCANKSYAGWFGPSNYDECVLEKMKGQKGYMLPTVRSACEKDFPYEKNITNFYNKIRTNWYDDLGVIIFKIEENFSDYRITRCVAIFSENTCEENSNNSNYALKANLMFNKGENISRFETNNFDGYQCMKIIEIWGILK
jgi:hypothetical protein